MKTNMKRIIKVLSSCVAIAMVLIVTVAMPAYALSNKVYTLSDLLYDKQISGDDVIITYSLKKSGVVPFIQLRKNGSTIDWENSDFFELYFTTDDAANMWDLRLYPMGVSNSTTSQPAFIDISDLKSLEQVKLNTKFYLDSGATNSVSGLTFEAYWAVSWIDKDGVQIKSDTGDVGTYSTSDLSSQWEFSVDASFTIPEMAVYMLPQIRLVIRSGGYDGTASLYMDYDRGILYASYNSVLQNTATMFAIEEKLGDVEDTLNSIDQSLMENGNKLDTIIEGKDEWHQEGQDNQEKQEQVDADAKDKMEEIDNATDLDNVLPDDAQKPEDLGAYVDEWLSDDSWSNILQIFKPILTNENFNFILLMIVSFINISVLLIGR